jgi:hypothetical protein
MMCCMAGDEWVHVACKWLALERGNTAEYGRIASGWVNLGLRPEGLHGGYMERFGVVRKVECSDARTGVHAKSGWGGVDLC